jgi:hypothetical protein
MPGRIQYVWEVLASFYLGYLGTLVASTSSTTGWAFLRLEREINIFLQIRQTDFIRGYLALWAPSTMAGLVIWLILRISAGTPFTHLIIRSVAGIVTMAGPFAFWLGASFWAYANGRASWPVGWVHGLAPFEMAAALAWTALFLSGNWKAPFWAGALVIAAHFVFWYFAHFNPYEAGRDLLSPAAFGFPLGLCAALSWAMHFSRVRKSETTARR